MFQFQQAEFPKNRQILPPYIVQMLKEKGDRWRDHIKFDTFDSRLKYKRARNRASKFLRLNRQEVASDAIASVQSCPKDLEVCKEESNFTIPFLYRC